MTIASKLNKKVVLQRRATGRDSFGQPLINWLNVIPGSAPEVWAGIEDVTGRQYVAAGATQNSVQTVITIRYKEGITPDMRVLHGDVVYDIEAVLGQNRKTLQLMVKRHA